MIEISTDFDEEIPRWDVALEALVREESEKQQRSLQIADFRRLANQYAIRFDDIMATVFELTLEGVWEYRDRQGAPRALARQDVDGLYVNGRLAEDDVQAFSGSWRPLASARTGSA